MNFTYFIEPAKALSSVRFKLITYNVTSTQYFHVSYIIGTRRGIDKVDQSDIWNVKSHYETRICEFQRLVILFPSFFKSSSIPTETQYKHTNTHSHNHTLTDTKTHIDTHENKEENIYLCWQANAFKYTYGHPQISYIYEWLLYIYIFMYMHISCLRECSLQPKNGKCQ